MDGSVQLEVKTREGWDSIGIATVSRWGLSYAVRLDKRLLKALNVKDGDTIKLAWCKVKDFDDSPEAKRIRETRRELMAAARNKIRR